MTGLSTEDIEKILSEITFIDSLNRPPRTAIEFAGLPPRTPLGVDLMTMWEAENAAETALIALRERIKSIFAARSTLLSYALSSMVGGEGRVHTDVGGDSYLVTAHNNDGTTNVNVKKIGPRQ